MKRLKVILAEIVREQIDAQAFYIARDSIYNALEWEKRLTAEIMAIGDMWGYAIDEEASERIGEEVRKKVFEEMYLIYYRVSEKAGVIEIVNFRHGMRLPGRGEP